jgi:hypothetical protein
LMYPIASISTDAVSVCNILPNPTHMQNYTLLSLSQNSNKIIILFVKIRRAYLDEPAKYKVFSFN